MESKRQGVVEEENSEAIEELNILGLRETFVWTIGFDCFIKSPGQKLRMKVSD